MIQLGLTGNIGAGKSTVAAVFQELGVPVFDVDRIGRELLEDHPEVINGIREIFGERAFTGGKPDRSKIAKLVFSDEYLLLKINNLIHPKVANEYQKWIKNQMSPLVIREAAILFESGSYRDLDKIMVVSCPEEERLKRVMKRDRVDEQQVRARMNKQMNEEEKMALADEIIVNDGSSLLVPQVLHILKKYLPNT